ncbi:ATPase [Zostera marina]|uniref:Phospholipid-transporting ATPase n=1 Tax=Zostera marina TaxID=29655 RepID=A0A0K9P921_ZOSMR|nr:ATPase [Zostera marina]
MEQDRPSHSDLPNPIYEPPLVQNDWTTSSVSVRAGSDRFGASQKEISDENSRLVYVNDPVKTNEQLDLGRNSIRTGKYTVFSFLPINLYEQFRRVAYVYFLVIAVLNQLPVLAVFGRTVSIIPLALVLTVTAVKDGYEDWRRHRSDKIENNRKVSVLVNGQIETKRWKDIRVGDVIKLGNNETLPCDMVLLSTSDPAGLAYVQTINLDGESNLKTRYARVQENVFSGGAGMIRCEKPNRNIYGFLANFEVDGKRLSLGPSNIILRGCELKNTEHVYGVAVYTGGDTKVMMNSSGAPSKRSRLETHMNREIIFLSLILFSMCALVAILQAVWLKTHYDDLDDILFYHKLKYSDEYTDGEKSYEYYGIGLESVFAFLSSVIVFQVMIPIALYISLELVRVGQAFFMVKDGNMYDEATNSTFQCRALNINEDLGQIKYVFSDKTGTLTENKMEFKCASIAGYDYSNMEDDFQGDYSSVSDDGEVWKPKVAVKTDPKLVKILNAGGDTEQAKYAREFFLALATCNTIVPYIVDTPDPNLKLVDYQGESPDEQALVYAAASYGFMLLKRSAGKVEVDVLGQRHTFNVLGLHEFDSERKRMSVIVQCPDSKIKLYVKGADSSMLDQISNSDVNMIEMTNAHLQDYSSSGLRTLVVGVRELTTIDIDVWRNSYEKASMALLGRGILMQRVAVDTERHLKLLGASGIEDKLQRGVPEAIESLRKAGMKVWVLTGDKQETAISIGYSSRLLTSSMTPIVINCHSSDSCRLNLRNAMETLTTSSSREHALIIDGKSLLHILDRNADLEQDLFDLATSCDVVLCCRVAPLQKAGIVALIKKRTDDMTLAIGDGANDVSMIQMADVGIGISGQEGRQAVMSSDFAMGQFRFLVPLLLVHGHWNYHRISYMILYNFYRNALLVLVLFWYVLYTGFTLITAITDWSTILYSVVYTSVPTIVIGILDKDIGRKTLLKYPQLYGSGQREERYNFKLFFLTMMDTIWQSVAIFYFSYLAYGHSTIDMSSMGDLYIIAIVILANVHLAMDVYRWNWVAHASIWGSTIATVICVIILDSLPDLPGYWAIFHAMGTGMFWLNLVGIVVAGLIPRFIVKTIVEYFWPDDIQIAREYEKFGNSTEIEMTNMLGSDRSRN